MANGFTQRWKGKVTAQSVWMGAQQFFGPGATPSYSTAGTQTLSIARAARISASSGASVFTLGFAPSPGLEFNVSLTTVSSAAFVKAAAGTAFTPSTATVFKSTYEMQVSLIGLSTTNWGIRSVWPPPSTLVGGSGITLSTTT